MKKYLPIILIVLFAFSFAACGDDDDVTTINITQPTATTNNPADEMSIGADGDGILLTTAFGETVPSVETTAFDVSADAVNAENIIPGENLTVPDVTVPVVVTDIVPSTAPPPTTTTQAPPPVTEESTADNGGTEPSATSPSGSESDTETDETSSSAAQGQSEDASTENPDVTETTFSVSETADNKTLNSIGSSNDDRGNIELIFDYEGWERVKSQKASAKVTCNGKTKTLKGTVNGVDDGGQFTFTVDISSLEPSDGDLVEIALTKGAVQTINGKQASASQTFQHFYG